MHIEIYSFVSCIRLARLAAHLPADHFCRFVSCPRRQNWAQIQSVR